MTYTPDIPVTGESLGSTRDRIRANFQQIDEVEAINHVAFNEADKGKHKYMQMPEVTASGAGVPSTAVNEGGLYTNVGTNPAEVNLFFRSESDGKVYQLTRTDQTNEARFAVNTVYSAGPPSLKGGWSFLPGGLVLQWGTYDTAESNSSFPITFPIQFPSDVFNIQVTGLRAASSPGNNTDAWVSTGGLTTTGFTIYNNGSHSFKFMWQAIGI